MSTNGIETEVAIMGGGLAGLTLAIHLRQRNPGLSIHIVERREHPVREAAFKVGESTVEIGAHYLAEVLGLREHLDTRHLRKFGFRFFFSDGREDIDKCLELGVSRVLPTPSWQIDRGRFENFLGEQAQSLGVRFDSGATIRRIELASDAAPLHLIEFDRKEGGQQRLSARWLIDASGRAGLLKRKLGLAHANGHDANAVWWRVAGHIDPNDWSDDSDWLARCDPPDRWRSTNHLCGPGYWVWLIPLASGSHSVGIVCDARMHPLEEMNSHVKATQWLQKRQPRLARTLAENRHTVQDFGYLRNYSYGSTQLLSDQRWAITGEAGWFLDPFYSPGTDFIAIANTYVCDLLERDLKEQPIAARTQIYQKLLTSFYDNALPLYENQYPLFGNARVMPLKIIWDYSYYWALLAPVFFANRLTDVKMLSNLSDRFSLARNLNLQMQTLFAKRGENERENTFVASGRLLDQHRIDWFYEMNRALTDRYDGSTELEKLISKNVDQMHSLADELNARIGRRPKGIDSRDDYWQPAGRRRSAALLQAEWYGAQT